MGVAILATKAQLKELTCPDDGMRRKVGYFTSRIFMKSDDWEIDRILLLIDEQVKLITDDMVTSSFYAEGKEDSLEVHLPQLEKTIKSL